MEELIFLHDFINLILMFIISVIFIILLYKYININLLRNQKIKFMWIGIFIIVLIQTTLGDFLTYEASFVLLPSGIIYDSLYEDTNSYKDFVNKVATQADHMASSTSGGNPPSRETFFATIQENLQLDSDIKILICEDIYTIKFIHNKSKAQIIEWFEKRLKNWD